MFTGIVERVGYVRAVEEGDGGRRLTILVEEKPGLPPWRTVEPGESIALSGVCLTAVASEDRPGGGVVSFDVVPETLSLTSLGDKRPGDLVNIERSLRVGESFSGHYVTGHIDGTGTIRDREEQGDQVLFRISTPGHLLKQIILKGSIAIDGISLTVVEIDRRSCWFSFVAIPHTLEGTCLGPAPVGSRVNIETDAFGKWVLHALDELDLREVLRPEDRSHREENERLRALLERTGFADARDPGERRG